MILAQDTTSAPTLKSVFGYILSFELPTRAEFIKGLEGMGPLVAVGLILVGLAFLIYGFRCFKAFVLADFAALGAIIGGYLGTLSDRGNLPLLLGLGVGVIFGVIAWKALKYAVAALGGMAGGLLGYGGWYLIAVSINNAGMLRLCWAGAIIGMIAIGMLTFVLFRPAVMVLTSLQGSVMIISGAISILVGRGLAPSLRDPLITNKFLLCVLIGVPAMIGFIIQSATEVSKIHKKRKMTEKPPV